MSNNSFTGIIQYDTEGKIEESENVIGKMAALRWEPTHITKHTSRSVPLQPAGKLMPNSIPEKPWAHISADFITKLPLAQGYDSILVVVD